MTLPQKILYENIPFSARILLLGWTIFLLGAFIYAGVRLLEQKRSAGLLAAAFLPGIYCLLQRMLEWNPENALLFCGTGSSPAAAAVLSVILFCTFVFFLLHRNIRSWARTHVTSMSVKEGVDTLPAGICCSFADGFPKLTNKKMEAICMEVTGAPLYDAERFYGALTGEGPCGAERIRTGPEPVLRLKNGSVYSFRREKRMLQDTPCFELLAVDVTEEYLVREELKEKKERADAVRRRLKELNRSITAMTVEKETLEAKTRLHDEWGRLLLTARRWYYAPDSVDTGALLSEWRRVIGIMKNEGPNAMCLEYVDAVRSAFLMGVDVAVEGILPETSPAKDLAVLAVNICVTNTLRHAEGRRLSVKSRKEDGSWHLVFRNDGKAPEGPVEEGGGLGGLRQKTEACGGSMIITSAPEFVLEITVPDKKNEGDAADDKRTDCG